MTDIYSPALRLITPPNLADDPSVSPVITALNPVLADVSQETHTSSLIAHLDSLPVSILDWLAWQWHSDFYDLAGTDTMKRETVRDSLTWHMRKGTPSAIISALKSLGVDAEFVPWWTFGGQPYTFRIKANITGDFYRGAGKDRITRLITRAVNEAKSARSLLVDLDTRLSFSERISHYAGLIRALSGHAAITHSRPEAPGHQKIYSAVFTGLSGQHIIPLHHEREASAKVYAGIITHRAYSQNIGVDLDTMQELLLQFEKRIFNRIDNWEAVLNAKIDTQYKALDDKINTVIELLRWKGDDEPLA
ncbi:MAG: phage tail protein I [Synergistaceae bacterium]|nr:phage tail protein I [Synergistaceae bacterium]